MYEARQGQTKKKEKQIGADDEARQVLVCCFFFLIFKPLVSTKLFVFQGCGPVGCVCVIYGLIDLGFDYKQMIDRVGAYPAPTLVNIQPGWGTISATDSTHTDYHSTPSRTSSPDPPLTSQGCRSLLRMPSLFLSLSQIGTSASKVDPLSLSLSPHSHHSRSG